MSNEHPAGPIVATDHAPRLGILAYTPHGASTPTEVHVVMHCADVWSETHLRSRARVNELIALLVAARDRVWPDGAQ